MATTRQTHDSSLRAPRHSTGGSNLNRHSSGRPCPVCGGHDKAQRGSGERCYGFVSGDWCHCTRDEHAGRSRYNARSQTWSHRLRGRCPCGTEHAPADFVPGRRKKTRLGTIDKVYRYHDRNGVVVHETVRYRDPKRFAQRRPIAGGQYRWSLQDVETVLYRLPELIASDPAEPVYLAEGEKDVDRLRALGVLASCNPMGAGKWRDHYSADLAGRQVVILADNDDAGRDHAALVAKSLHGKAASVKVVAPPGLPPKGDVSDWLDGGGSIDRLVELARNAAEWTPTTEQEDQEPIEAVEALDDPHRLARVFRDGHCRHPDGLTQRYYRDEHWRWNGSAFEPLPIRELHAFLSDSCKTELDRANKLAVKDWADRGGTDGRGRDSPAPEARKVGTGLIADVAQALTGMTLVGGKVETPEWLVDDPPFAASEVLPCRNALVHLPTLVQGGNAIVPPTPLFFNRYALDYDFQPDAPAPSHWFAFLDSLWGDDPESIAALQEWFGYCLTEDTRQQKIAALLGPKRAGKDTIARILRAMIGAENVVGPTLSSLATNFGLWPLLGKPLAIISDARLSGRLDTAVIVERLLTISGEGTLTVDRKNLSAWTGKLPTRLLLISNELPRLPDSSGALSGRLILFRLTRSFFGKEDRTLFDRLKTELPGILHWSIEGWRRLNERGHFLQPESGRDLVEQLADIESPVSNFIHERCEVGPGLEIETADLFQAWQSWCDSIGRDKPGDAQNFGRHLGAALPGVKTVRTRRGDGVVQRQIRVYVGIRLKSCDGF